MNRNIPLLLTTSQAVLKSWSFTATRGRGSDQQRAAVRHGMNYYLSRRAIFSGAQPITFTT